MANFDFNERNIPKYSLCGLIYKIRIPWTKIPPFQRYTKYNFWGYRALLFMAGGGGANRVGKILVQAN